MIIHDTATLVRLTYNLYNAHQSDPDWLDKSVLQIDTNCELVNIPTGEILHGREGFRQFLLNWSTAFPDSRVEVINIAATSDQAAVEFMGRGTHTGVLRTPKGDVQPTGRKIDLRFCDVYHTSYGQIISLHSYYDRMTMLQQLGLLPT